MAFREKAPVYMRKLMKDFDFSVEDAAAIMGNLGHESNGLMTLQERDPRGGGRGGYGWAQWTGERRRAYEAYCVRNGKDPASDEANYGWLFNELKTTESKAVGLTKHAVGLKDKVEQFELAFERAGVKHYDRRLKWAETALDAYNDMEAPTVEDLPNALEATALEAVMEIEDIYVQSHAGVAQRRARIQAVVLEALRKTGEAK
jgi:hypothetical protein